MADLVHRLTDKMKPRSQEDAHPTSRGPSFDRSADNSHALNNHAHGSSSPDNRRSIDAKHHRTSVFGGVISKFKKGDDSDSDFSKDNSDLSKNQARKQHKEDEDARKRQHRDRELMAQQQRRRDEVEAAQREDSPEMRARYGSLPINNYSGKWQHKEHLNLLDLSTKDVGQEISCRVRIHNMRKLSAKLVFFVLRQQTATMQGVLQESERVSKHMVYWAEHLPVESIMFVKGIVQKPKAKEGEVKGALLHDIELFITEFHVVSRLADHLPFTVNEAEVTQAEADEEG